MNGWSGVKSDSIRSLSYYVRGYKPPSTASPSLLYSSACKGARPSCRHQAVTRLIPPDSTPPRVRNELPRTEEATPRRARIVRLLYKQRWLSMITSPRLCVTGVSFTFRTIIWQDLWTSTWLNGFLRWLAYIIFSLLLATQSSIALQFTVRCFFYIQGVDATSMDDVRMLGDK